MKGNGRGLDLGEKENQWKGGKREEWRDQKLQLECIENNKYIFFKSGTKAAVATGMGVGLQQAKEHIIAEKGWSSDSQEA